jgi:LPXTG-motif cell wall-anchored protein
MKKLGLSKLWVLSLALAAAAWTGVPAHADAPLVTIDGTVVSRDGDHLVVNTAKGNLTFDIDKTTEMTGVTLTPGSKITLWYDSDDKPEDRMDVRKIAMTPAVAAPAPVTTPSPTVSTPAPEPVTQTTTTTDTNDELPSTASPLPLFAVAGLLSLVAGAFALRRRAA